MDTPDKKIVPNMIKLDAKISAPALKESLHEELKFEGASFTAGKSVDDFPTVLKTDWFDGVLVSHETYGGGCGVVDSCCLIYSILKSVSPDMQHVDAKNAIEHGEQRHNIARSFKLELVEYLLKDNAVDTGDKKTDKRVNEQLEMRIKKKFTVSNKLALVEFISNVEEYFRNEKGIEDMKTFIEDPSLTVDQDTLDAIEKLYIDPRNFKAPARLLNLREDLPVPYFFSQELRELPLTTGIFDVLQLFETDEDYRILEQTQKKSEQVFKKLGSFPTLKLFAENMIFRQEHEIMTAKLISQILNVNIAIIEPFIPPLQVVKDYITNCRGDYNTIKLIKTYYTVFPNAEQVMKYFVERRIPTILISGVPGHYQSASVLHEMPIEGSDEKCYQAQTMFSHNDRIVKCIRKSLFSSMYNILDDVGELTLKFPKKRSEMTEEEKEAADEKLAARKAAARKKSAQKKSAQKASYPKIDDQTLYEGFVKENKISMNDLETVFAILLDRDLSFPDKSAPDKLTDITVNAMKRNLTVKAYIRRLIESRGLPERKSVSPLQRFCEVYDVEIRKLRSVIKFMTEKGFIVESQTDREKLEIIMKSVDHYKPMTVSEFLDKIEARKRKAKEDAAAAAAASADAGAAAVAAADPDTSESEPEKMDVDESD